MDWIGYKTSIAAYWKKYRYIGIVLLAGFLLISFPQQKQDSSVPEAATIRTETMEQSLSALLSKLSGAGKVEVLLSRKSGEETIFQLDEDRTSGTDRTELRTDTVMVTDAQRNETGLIRQINPPVYLGAVILCQGADNAAVRLSVVEAVKSATGLSSDRITVLKMK